MWRRGRSWRAGSREQETGNSKRPVGRRDWKRTMAEFLFEIGLEEVPARMIAGAQAELQRRVVGMLEREYLLDGNSTSRSYSTPRRLAVLVTGVLAQAPSVNEGPIGPSVKVAFKDGVPTPAAEAFARKCGLTVNELDTIALPKGDYLTATIRKAGRGAAEVIAEELPKELAGIYWAKNMVWRGGGAGGVCGAGWGGVGLLGGVG